MYVMDISTGTKDTKVTNEEAKCECLENENNWKPRAWHSSHMSVEMILVDPQHNSQGRKETHMREVRTLQQSIVYKQ